MKTSALLLATLALGTLAKERLPNLPTKGSMVDKRNNIKYETVTLGGQTWMAENLDFPMNGSKCHEDKPANCDRFGRLYSWEGARRVCPQGWHLPSKDEWTQLKAVAGEEHSGKLLREAGWTNGSFWSATEVNDIAIWALGLEPKDSSLTVTAVNDRRIGLGVRCLQD